MAADTFTYADGALVTVSGGAWQNVDDPFTVSSGRATFAMTANDSVAAWSTAVGGDDQYSEADVDLTSTTGATTVGVCTRIDTAAMSYMTAQLDENGGGRLFFQARINGGLWSGVLFPTWSTGGAVAGRLKLESIGTTHNLYWNGVLTGTITTTNSSPSSTARKVGIQGYRETGSVASFIDNWAGDVVGGAGAQAWTGSTATVTVAGASGAWSIGTTAGSVFVGAAAISNVKLGAAQVQRLYVGASLAWQFAAPTAQTWTGSTATVTVAGTSNTWATANSPQTWIGGTATVLVAGSSGTWVAAQLWTGSTATVTVAGTSGAWSVGAAPQTWTGSSGTVTVAGASGAWSVASVPGIAFKANLGNNVAAAGGSTSLVITTTAAIAVDDLIVVRVAADNLNATTPTFTCTDSGNNVYTTHAQRATNATAASGVAGAIMCAYASTAISTGGTITVVLSSATPAHRAAYATSFTGANNTLRATPTAAATGTTAAVSSGASSTVSSGDLVLGWSAIEGNNTTTGDADTLNGTWSTLVSVSSAAGGTAASRVQVNGQHKIVTASGAQTYDNTTTATDWVAGTIVMQPVGPQTWTASSATVTVAGTSGTWSVDSPATGFAKYRHFNGIADQADWTLGNLAGVASVPQTLVAVVRRVGVASADGELFNSPGYDPVDWFHLQSANIVSFYNGTANADGPTWTADTWQILAIRIPSGAPVKWSQSIHNGTAWPTPTHTTTGTTYTNLNYDSTGVFTMANTPPLSVDIVCIARFSTALTDAQINAMTAGVAAIQATPTITNLWMVGQSSPADLVGTSTATLTGTTLSSGDSPFAS
jgi:hypothetical protein